MFFFSSFISQRSVSHFRLAEPCLSPVSFRRLRRSGGPWSSPSRVCRVRNVSDVDLELVTGRFARDRSGDLVVTSESGSLCDLRLVGDVEIGCLFT